MTDKDKLRAAVVGLVVNCARDHARAGSFTVGEYWLERVCEEFVISPDAIGRPSALEQHDRDLVARFCAGRRRGGSDS